MDKIIRVAQVIGKAINGGTEAFAMNYYLNIDRSKVQFDFFVESTSGIINRERIESLGGRVIIIPSYNNVFKYMKTLTKLFKEGNYDVVHSNMNTLSVFTLRAAKMAGIPVRIAHSHSTANRKEWKKTFAKNLLRPFSKVYATHYCACSEIAGRWLFGNRTFDRGEVIIINNAIDLDRFKFNVEIRQKLRDRLKVSDELVVGHIGRFCQQKNQLFLLNVFQELLKVKPSSKLLLIGNGEMDDELKFKAYEMNLSGSVIFAGVKRLPEDYYQAMDCFVLPSLYEGLGMVAVEAQVSGLPCIVSNNVPDGVTVNDNVVHLKLDRDYSKWVDAILSCAGKREKLDVEKFRLNGYDILVEAQKLVNMYKRFCASDCER